MKALFEKGYFVNSKVSNYKDYRSKKFNDLCLDLVKDLRLTKYKTILDAGCATGGLLNAFSELGFNKLYGFDISRWAVMWGRKNYPRLRNKLLWGHVVLKKDIVLCLDVLEHLDDDDLDYFLMLLRNCLDDKLIVRVPVSIVEGEDYFLPVSRNDKTHVQIHCKDWWKRKIESAGFKFLRSINRPSIFDSEGVFVGVFENEG